MLCLRFAVVVLFTSRYIRHNVEITERVPLDSRVSYAFSVPRLVRRLVVDGYVYGPWHARAKMASFEEKLQFNIRLSAVNT